MLAEELLLQMATGLLFHHDADIIEPIKDIRVKKDNMIIQLQNGSVYEITIIERHSDYITDTIY